MLKITKKRGMKVNRWDTPEPAEGECSCGQTVVLYNPLSNECDCGKIYNMSGQQVRAREEDCDDSGVPLSDYEDY